MVLWLLVLLHEVVIFVKMDSVQLFNFVKLESRYQLSCDGNFQQLATSTPLQQPPPPSHCYIQCSRACWRHPECTVFAFSPTALKKSHQNKYKTATGGAVCRCYQCQLQNQTGVKYLWKPSSFETWVQRQDLSVLMERVVNVTSSTSGVLAKSSISKV
ncbi:hypothetical protein ElyMa_003117200 [Elysia marginata]|uniref:Apple domain-containing protein n=1 Tax=Elysia marginata TaxID=1093978 RepID=A0AAV4ITQ3_9GAST|nr:hypothetical protein ElyMa_003117200 [Elysia marginata]